MVLGLIISPLKHEDHATPVLSTFIYRKGRALVSRGQTFNAKTEGRSGHYRRIFLYHAGMLACLIDDTEKLA